MRSAVPIASAPAAQADTVLNAGPFKPWRRARFAAPALPIISGMPSGDTRPGPDSLSTSCWVSIVEMPPMPVPITVPMRVGSIGSSSPSVHPACSSASAQAAIASWAKRSVRRSSFFVSTSPGSNSLQAPTPDSIPHSPAFQRSYSVVAPLPSGDTTPTPVMTHGGS